MIRDDRFLISRKPYAVDLGSLRGKCTPSPQGQHPYYFDGQINAVWFRRKKGVTVACIGTLWDLQHPEPTDAAQFLRQHTDGRYGGRCEARWDGSGYWGAEAPDAVAEHLALLRPMLDGYPLCPASHDGWWRF